MQFCYTICTFAAAAGSTSQAYGFLVIWSMMMTLAFSAAGTAVLRRPDYRTHLAVGALIGTSAMQANLMLIVAVISGANMNKATSAAATPASFTATETFAAMLFMAYTTFTVFVYSWKDILLPAEGGAPGAESAMPPAGPTAYGGQFDGGSYGGGAGGVIGTDHVAQVEGSTAL